MDFIQFDEGKVPETRTTTEMDVASVGSIDVPEEGGKHKDEFTIEETLR